LHLRALRVYSSPVGSVPMKDYEAMSRKWRQLQVAICEAHPMRFGSDAALTRIRT